MVRTYTQRDLAELRLGILRRRAERRHSLIARKEAALVAAERAANLIRQRYNCRVWLFGSLAGAGKFDEHSDIDLAVESLPTQADFWRLYADVLAEATPFDVDLVILETASPKLREAVRRWGVELA